MATAFKYMHVALHVQLAHRTRSHLHFLRVVCNNLLFIFKAEGGGSTLFLRVMGSLCAFEASAALVHAACCSAGLGLRSVPPIAPCLVC